MNSASTPSSYPNPTTRDIVRVAALQTSYGSDRTANVEKTERLIREAAAQGAQIILPSELFEGPYFCKTQDEDWFSWALPTEGHPTIERMQALAKELAVVIPVSFFERSATCTYNSVAVIDADGELLGVYRKSHIPDGPGYQEKFYFAPGDTGFCAWTTRYGRIGVGICWDQWFPECARAMCLDGAEILLYPTAIGTEPENPSLDTALPWRTAMLGHSVSNLVTVVAANRIGDEPGPKGVQHFYGTSFIASALGRVVADAGRDAEAILTADIDLGEQRRMRSSWGFFRDRRPELYGPLLGR
jgi:N-carbamoylputrescine amidase